VASCTDQDANAAHDWNVMGYRQMAYCVVIREEYGVLFDGEGDHHHIDDGDGGGDECCIADLFEDMRLGGRDDTNAILLTQGGKFVCARTTFPVGYHFVVYLWQGDEMGKIARQEIGVLEACQMDEGSAIGDGQHYEEATLP